MPAQLAYPGVYIEEVPSGSRTISGTATSVTAFIGRAKRGSVNKAIRVQSFGQFEREFGGLWRHSTMSYAVQHFFQNGGGDTVIIRLCKNAAKAGLTLACGTGEGAEQLMLEANNEGIWGNNLKVTVDNNTSAELEAQYGLEAGDLFNLTITDTLSGAAEEFRNISVKESPRQIDDILSGISKLARVSSGTLPVARPNAITQAAFDGGTDGTQLTGDEYTGSESKKTGIYALNDVDIVNLVCIPPISDDDDTPVAVLSKAITLCRKKRAMLIVDSPKAWVDVETAEKGLPGLAPHENGAIFFPRLLMPDPLQENRIREFAPCGAVAGVFARTDVQRGIWKAPAGTNAVLMGVQGFSVNVSDGEQGHLNPLGINCLRSFPVVGNVIYGARTLKGADQLASEFKYIPVRRLTLHIEENLYRGTQFAVFEPNDERLWSDIRYTINSFMHDLFRKGAFQGTNAAQAYFVKCDADTTIQEDINRGIVNIVVGFAPLKPAEFIVIKLQQMAGQV
ncbi:phage tail sheath C-terminal domain-containing protein [Desulfonema magnum]|uniref:Phage tail domain-containing protein n=1 Tax=Desulfonema magnum TaxID=45655 RepID=A0A975BQ35_9BACT|nr:phage tail sheath C-terminal domain-containing protein [Desulfonema magnum]QTA89109.1 Phage tail domain-containing protein [Desulfonema magnum]